MKKAIFAVHTEFHLMFTLKMINLLPEFKESQNIILRISPVGTNRLKDSYNFSGTGIEYRELFYNYGFFKEKGLKQAFEDFILSESPSYYVLFFEFQYWYSYLLPKIKRIGAEIILAPDGVNLYLEDIGIKRRFKYFFYNNLLLWTNGFFCFMRFPAKHSGYRKEIDTIIMENKEAIGFFTRKKVVDLEPIYQTEVKSISGCIKRCFNYVNEYDIIEKGSFLILDQPMSEDEGQRMVEIMKSLKCLYPETNFYIKPHPHSNWKIVQTFEEILNGKIINPPIPAELILDNLEGVGIISICSTALLHRNLNCRYYWIYPMFSNNAGFTLKTLPFEHIQVVYKLDDIKPFLNDK